MQLNKGMELFKILRNRTNVVRTTLCIEDVKFSNYNVLNGFGIVSKALLSQGEVLFFTTPFRVPKFNIFYASRIKNSRDPYLVELIKRVLYLNPAPNALLIKKITEFIILNFSILKQKQSEVTGRMVSYPVLTFEEVEPVVKGVSLLTELEGYAPDNEDVVMFSRKGSFSKQDKIKIRANHRMLFVANRLEQVIHTIAEHLIDEQTLIKVTGSGIESTKMVTTDTGPASVRTIRKYMSDRTKNVIEEHNEYAPFKSIITSKKYADFLKLPNGISLDEIASTLNISKRTAIDFRVLSSKDIGN